MVYNIPYENNLYYKLLHWILDINQKHDIAEHKNNISPICDRCNKDNETIIHVFYNCRNRKKVWKTFEHIIQKLNKKSDNNPIINILGLDSINTKHKTRKLIITINTSVLNEIRKGRNLFKHEQKKMPTDNIIQNIKRNIKEIITIHFNKHEKSFKEKFTIENALCNIENDSTTFHFWNKTKDLSHKPVIHIHTQLKDLVPLSKDCNTLIVRCFSFLFCL